MLHNKNYTILSQFLSNYNKEIYGRELIHITSLSQKNIALTLEDLEKKGILKSRLSGNIKYYRLNFDSTELKDIILVLETLKKIDFFNKQRKIANLFRYDNRIVGIFGSYAKGIQKKESDIDVFIIGNKIKEDYDRLGEKLDLNISIKYFSEKEFINLIKNKNNLIKEIIKDHIIIFKFEEFINLIWRNYYDSFN